MPTFCEPAPEQYIKLEPDTAYRITIMERLPDHEEFTCGKEPAKVYRVKDKMEKTPQRLTVTSVQFERTLQAVEKHMGTIYGFEMIIRPKGDKKERTYSVEVPDDSAQTRIPTVATE